MRCSIDRMMERLSFKLLSKKIGKVYNKYRENVYSLRRQMFFAKYPAKWQVFGCETKGSDNPCVFFWTCHSLQITIKDKRNGLRRDVPGASAVW